MILYLQETKQMTNKQKVSAYNVMYFTTVNIVLWLLYQMNLHIVVYNADFTYITFAIIGIFYLISLYVVIKSFLAKNSSEFDHYFKDLFTGLGLLGTIIGFVYAFGDLQNLDVSNVETTKEVIKNLLMSMQTAFFTTIAGIVCSLALTFQLIILDFNDPHEPFMILSESDHF